MVRGASGRRVYFISFSPAFLAVRGLGERTVKHSPGYFDRLAAFPACAAAALLGKVRKYSQIERSSSSVMFR